MAEETPGKETKPGEEGSESTPIAENVPVKEVDSGSQERKPSDSQLRIQQLVREKNALKEELATATALKPEPSNDSTDNGQRSREEIRSEFKAVMAEERIERERVDALEYIQSQQGYEPDLHRHVIEDIAEKNGWVGYSQESPMKAAKLVMKEFAKVHGKKTPETADAAQAAGAQSSASGGGEVDAEASMKASLAGLDHRSEEDRKKIDEIYLKYQSSTHKSQAA